MKNNDGLVERLRALHVWPQFVADEHADLLRPRYSKGLYAVGEVAHEAADTILRLRAELAAQHREAERARLLSEDNAEKVARALAKADGLDFDEICGVDADPDEGFCDSGTCVAAHWEEHDAEQARRWYTHLARAALAALGEV